mmetsp:Transcript_43600/g.128385  ORF Transcript_43600/g.128385 Transcript_43600/m.128385 type:complete len:143 (-) Transcript_43600:212-640(-)
MNSLVSSARACVEHCRKTMMAAVGGDGSKAAGLVEVSDLWVQMQQQNGNHVIALEERLEDKHVREMHAALYKTASRSLPPLDASALRDCRHVKPADEGGAAAKVSSKEPSLPEAEKLGALLVMGSPPPRRLRRWGRRRAGHA